MPKLLLVVPSQLKVFQDSGNVMGLALQVVSQALGKKGQTAMSITSLP